MLSHTLTLHTVITLDINLSPWTYQLSSWVDGYFTFTASTYHRGCISYHPGCIDGYITFTPGLFGYSDVSSLVTTSVDSNGSAIRYLTILHWTAPQNRIFTGSTYLK